MDQSQFSRQFDELHARLRDLQEQSPEDMLQKQELLEKALEYLGTSVEELRVAEEELRRQNEELANTRDALEAERNRYSDLFEFAPDAYLVTDEAGMIRAANHAAASLFNLPQELLRNKPLSNFISEEERKAFRKQLLQLKASSGSQEWSFRIQPRNAQPFFASLTVTLTQDDESSAPTLRWLMRDITRRVNAERALAQKSEQVQLLEEIASAANLANSVEDALQFAVDRICAFTGWPVGHVYLTQSTPTPVLVATNIWHIDEPEKFATFRQVTEKTRLKPGKGLSGRVLASGKPEWVVDVISDPGFARLSIPEDRSVRAGLFFPILIRQEVAGVLEFFATVTVEPDEKLLDMMAHIGTQLGRVVERDRSQAAVKAREEMLRAAGNIAPVVNFILDRNGVIQLSIGKSLTRRRYGLDPIGKSIFDLFRDTPAIIEGYQSALAGNSISTLVESEGLVFDTHYAPLKNEKGEIIGVIGAAADITKFRQMMEELRESENRFRTIFTEADLGMVLVDLQCQIVESNPAIQEMLGYTKNELEGTCLLDYLGIENPSGKETIYQELFSGTIDHFHREERYLHKDGTLIWANEGVSLLRDENGQPQYAIAMIENISAEKQMEVELSELERRLFEGMEAERLHLAQELHDGPLQDLYSATFQLSPLANKAQDDAEQQSYTEIKATIQQVIHTLRSICGELRPPALVPFGLEKAIRSQAEQMQELHPEIKIKLDLMKDGQEIQETVRIALYRIYQQILINVIRHAQASQVTIRFEFNEQQITLVIRDNGKGFKVPERWIELVRQGHFGLVGAAERAEALGGRLRIKSWQGAGTVIYVVVPRQVDYQTPLERRFSALIPMIEPQDPASPENI